MTLKTTMDNSGNNDSWPANRQTIVMPNGQRQRVHCHWEMLLSTVCKRPCYQCFSVIVADVVCLLNVGRASHWALRNNADNHPGADNHSGRRSSCNESSTSFWVPRLGYNHFEALAGRGSIFTDFLLNSHEKPTILGPWLARARFSLIFY